MEVIAPVLDNLRVGHPVAKEQQRLEDAVNQFVDDVWENFGLRTLGTTTLLQHGSVSEADLQNELSFRSPQPPLCTQPPPSYDDALADVPPEYSTLPPLAERKSVSCDAAPPTPATKSDKKSHSFWKDGILNADVDFGTPVGIREHKKKNKPAPGGKKVVPTAPPADTGGGSDNAGGDAPSGDGGGDAGGDGGGGDGGGGGGDDDWNAWTTTGSKKKTKKQEEEEEEARKAAEASAANNLSWADDADGGDDWAGFETAGKKKKGKVWLMHRSILTHLLISTTGPGTARWLSGCKPE